jgi:hypothetical protein
MQNWCECAVAGQLLWKAYAGCVLSHLKDASRQASRWKSIFRLSFQTVIPQAEKDWSKAVVME